ncbi:MAG: CDC48 family AAA ATPase [Phycisphaerales bacterium]
MTSSAAKASDPVRLRVSEALAKDVGRGIARMDPADMHRLAVGVGDAIAVRGQRVTVCKVWPAFREDRGGARIQLDPLARENAGAGLDTQVSVSPCPVGSATSVSLAAIGRSPTPQDLEYIVRLLDGLIVTPGDRVQARLFGSGTAEFSVESVEPAGSALITPSTVLRVPRAASGSAEARVIGYEDIGGLGTQLGRVREMIELPLRFPTVFDRLGITPPKGVLLHGPPGTGKTLIARTIAHETEAAFFTISGPEVVHRHYGESEKHLREIWAEATRKAPSIIFIDEIDAIAPRRESTEGEVEKRIVAQLLTLMDGLEPRAGVVVIAATNIPNNLDPALRRPGRFDREIEMPVPDREARRHILEIHSRGMPLAADVSLDHLASVTHGFVGADLEALCRESAMACLRGVLDEIDFSAAAVPYEVLSRLEVSAEHFSTAMHEVTPSAIREVIVEVPSVRWRDIGGLETVKQRLIEAVEWPLEHATLFQHARLRPPKGVLLHGPPGVGKTLLAKALATETNANFIAVKGPELLSRFVGDSERALREIFRKARQAGPCIVFFDEIDALLPRRGASQAGEGVAERMLGQFLTELDGIEELRGVLVLGATNRLDMLDAAVLRPGRFDEVIGLGLPDAEARRSILEVHLGGRPLADGINTAAIARRCEGLSGAELASVCTRAARRAVRRVVDRLHHGDAALPRLTPADIEMAIQEVMGDERGNE